MNENNAKKDAYEQYVEASVALYMEQYSKELTKEVLEESPSPNDIVFPDKLDKKCQALIKNAVAHRRRKAWGRLVYTGLRNVAIFAVILLSVACILFVSVEAFRISVINYYIEHKSSHWEISGVPDLTQDAAEKYIDITNPLANLIPAEYTLIVAEGDSLAELTAIYENSNGAQIFFSSVQGDSIVGVDSEEAQFSQECEICGCKAVLVTKDSSVRIIWIDENASIIYTIIVDNMTETDVVSIAEQFIKKLFK